MLRTALTLTLLLTACGGNDPAPAPKTAPAPAVPTPPPAPTVPPAHTNLFKPLVRPALADADRPKVDLGRMLYFDGRLSAGGDVSCNTCHDLAKVGVDGTPTSAGHKGQRGDRNSPTVYNAALHFAQFWDGRAADVEAQAKGPMLNPVEMALPDAKSAEKAIAAVAGYKSAFAAAFPGQANPVTFDNMAIAIGAFERQLITPGRFDKYLSGDATALTEAERKGLDTFIATGCTACHNGGLLGGGSYQKLGAVQPYETKDEGRKKVTGNAADAFMFKVPSLRNISRTGPWFHDGSVTTLEDAVLKMGRHQLGKELKPEEVASIITFLKALDGDVDAAFIAKPALP